MTSEPQRPGDRGPGAADPGRHRQEAGGGRASTGGPGQPGEVPRVEAERDAEVALAALGYLGAVFTGPVIPLGTYLIGRRISPFTRYHAAAALNLSLTWLLYTVCCLILGGLLLLDSLTAALVVTVTLAVWIWVCTVGYLIRGIGAAIRGEPNAAPAWICAQITR